MKKRQIFKARIVGRATKSNNKPNNLGKYYPELDGDDVEIKPMSDESKEAAVEFLREFKNDANFLDGYKK